MLRYVGLRGRRLESLSPLRSLFESKGNDLEDEVLSTCVIGLGSLKSHMVETVKRLCEPLFVVFDFASFSDDVYQGIVSEFLRETS
jgi:hypothetical protein